MQNENVANIRMKYSKSILNTSFNYELLNTPIRLIITTKIKDNIKPFNKKKVIQEEKYALYEAPIIVCTSLCFYYFSLTHVITAPLQNNIIAKGI